MRVRLRLGKTLLNGVNRRVVLRLMGDQAGVSAIEYTLIAALIAIAAVVLIAQIGTEVSTPFSTVAGKL